MPPRWFFSVILLVIAAAAALYTGSHFRSLYEREPVVQGPGVTRSFWRAASPAGRWSCSAASTRSNPPA
jgi:hypothetical protein